MQPARHAYAARGAPPKMADALMVVVEGGYLDRLKLGVVRNVSNATHGRVGYRLGFAQVLHGVLEKGNMLHHFL